MSDSSVVGAAAAAAAPQAAPGAGSTPAPAQPVIQVAFDDLMKFVEAVSGRAEKVAAPVEKHAVADAKAEMGHVWSAVKAAVAKLMPSGHTVTAVAAFTALALHFPKTLAALAALVGM